MENLQILNTIKTFKKGTWVRLEKKKDLGNGVVKYTTMTIRLGIDYGKMKENLGKEVGQLPWGQWCEGLEGYVIEHKGTQYLRVYNSYSKHINSYFTLNGGQISKEKAIEILGKEEKTSSSSCYNIKFENIVSLG